MKSYARQDDWGRYLAQQAAATQDPALARFYQAAWPTADTPLAETEFVAMDIETTGLDAQQHAIVSIGLIPFTLQRIRSDQAWYQIVRPYGDLIPESVTFHHITHSDIYQAPRFAQIIEPLLQQLAGRTVVAHYRNIERSFIDEAFKHALGEGLLFPIIDTMQIEADLYPQRKTGWFARFVGRQSISIRLADSRTRYGLPTYQAHHALTDALGAAELFQAQVATHFSPEQRIGDFWY